MSQFDSGVASSRALGGWNTCGLNCNSVFNQTETLPVKSERWGSWGLLVFIVL